LTELNQSRLFDRRRFRLLEDGVDVDLANGPKKERYKIPFEHLTNDVREATESLSDVWLWGSGFAAVVSIGMVINHFKGETGDQVVIAVASLAIAVGLCGWYVAKFKHYVWIVGTEQPLVCLANYPSKECVSDFLQEVEAERGKYLAKHYSDRPSSMNVVEYLERISYLHKSGSLTDEEFAILKERAVSPNTGDQGDHGGYL